MKKEALSVGARAAMGERVCQLYLRPVNPIPNGLWSWKVYVDGNINARGPGSTRQDPLPWYGALLDGDHRIVIREADTSKPDRIESNTLHFTISGQNEITINVLYGDKGPRLELVIG